jgi:hypothetical protein
MISKNYTAGTCFLPYDPAVIAILIMLLGVILPLYFCIGATIYISVIISKIKKKKYEKTVSKMERKTKLSSKLLIKLVNFKKLIFENAQVKLTIITTIFVCLYLPYPMSWAINSIYVAVSDEWIDVFYLMSYSNSMINPIILLILNFKFFRKQIRSGNISIALH